MKVDSRRFEAGMPKQDLDGAEVCPGVKQVSGAGWMHGTARLLPGKQPVRGPAPAPVSAQQSQQFGREHDLAGLPLFTMLESCKAGH